MVGREHSSATKPVRRCPGLIEGFGLALASSALLYALLPSLVVAFNDDFGYYRSVIETYARGRPWTDDWLEPWSASLSVLSASVLAVTGSFTWATYGVLIACYGLSAFFCGRVLQARGMRKGPAVVTTALLLTNGTMLWKHLEFTSMALSTALLLVAIDSALHRRRILFLIVWVLGIATRQSSVAWGLLILPDLFERRSWRKGFYAQPAFALAILLTGGIAYFCCSAWMNRTHAQSVMTAAMWANLRLGGVAAGLVICLCIGSVATGVSALFLGGRSGRDGHPSVRRRLWRYGMAVVCLCTPWIVSGRVESEHSLYAGALGSMYWFVVAAAGMIGWLFCPPRLAIGTGIAALGAAALFSLRSSLWDYYLCDFAILAMTTPIAGPAARQADAADKSSRGITGLAISVATIVLCFHAHFATAAKEQLDSYALLVRGYETALRGDRISVDELSTAPFGFLGWHLYPYFVRRDGADGRYIADFTKYVRPDAVRLETRSAKDPRPLEHPEAVVATATGIVGWRHSHQFILRKNGDAGPPVLRLDEKVFQLEPFPLSAAEWWSLAERRRRVLLNAPRS